MSFIQKISPNYHLCSENYIFMSIDEKKINFNECDLQHVSTIRVFIRVFNRKKKHVATFEEFNFSEGKFTINHFAVHKHHLKKGVGTGVLKLFIKKLPPKTKIIVELYKKSELMTPEVLRNAREKLLRKVGFTDIRVKNNPNEEYEGRYIVSGIFNK